MQLRYLYLKRASKSRLPFFLLLIILVSLFFLSPLYGQSRISGNTLSPFTFFFDPISVYPVFQSLFSPIPINSFSLDYLLANRNRQGLDTVPISNILNTIIPNRSAFSVNNLPYSPQTEYTSSINSRISINNILTNSFNPINAFLLNSSPVSASIINSSFSLNNPSLANVNYVNSQVPLPLNQFLSYPLFSPQINGFFNWRSTEVIVPLDAIPIYTFVVVNTYPHDLSAFTQGLVYENGFLYEGTGIPGRSSLRRVEPETGNILQMIELAPQYFGEGITIWGNTIVQLTWLHQIGFVYDKVTFELLQEFSYPTEGWGITHDGQNLIMSDGTATLHFLDPVTFVETSQLEVFDADGPVTRLNELEYIKGEIFANVWLTDRIARISPKTGQVIGWIDLTGLLNSGELLYPVDVLNGIAYDYLNDRLLVTGKFWPFLFEIDLIPLP